MWSSDSDRDEPLLATEAETLAMPSPSACSMQPQTPPPRRRRHRNRRRGRRGVMDDDAAAVAAAVDTDGAEAEEEVWRGAQWESAWPRRAARPVVLAGEDEPGADGNGAGAGAGGGEGGGVGRARSLTDDDLEELKGCVDLGFGFSYDEIPELCGTLPALELCYSMSQRFLDEHQSPPKPEKKAAPVAPPSPAQPIPNWKISSPGDSPDEVKARLKYWAQAVACTVKLCS